MYEELVASDFVDHQDVVAGNFQVMAAGQTARVGLVLESGEYSVFCAIPEDESRRPLLMHGMVSAIVVE